MDITIPAKRVNIHVQDPSGNPVAGVKIQTDNQPGSSNLTLGTLSGHGDSWYSSPLTTNASGDIVFWLFPTSYDFSAIPPTGSGLSRALMPNRLNSTDVS